MYAVKSRSPHRLFVKMVCVSLVAVSGAQAQILLLDPSTTFVAPAQTTFASANVPYSVPTSSIWNRSSNGTFSAPVFSDGSGGGTITVAADELQNAAVGAVYNFGSPLTGNSGNVLTGVFTNNPTNNALWGGQASNVGYGGIGMKIGGLAFGTYDIYVVAAYVGSTTSTRPGAGSAAQYDIWGFAGTNLSTLTAGTYGTANDRLENSTTASWISSNNYTKLTVTLDASNPFLYLISEGAVNDSRRGWMNAVQIVSVPEPVAPILLSLGAVALFIRRRRF